MNLHKMLQWGQTMLEQAEIEDAKADAWYLLEYVTGINRQQYFMDMEQKVAPEQNEEYERLIQQRVSHIPLQHLTGTQEFMGLTFRVSEDVLIPRQDTEVLVETVLEQVEPGMRILDMCTGSGCILISLLKFGKALQGTGVDLSEKALEMARKNQANLEVDAMFLQSDLFEKVEEQYDVIVSNPPYIPTAVIRELQEEVKMHDPILALDGKEDGLSYYRKIIAQAPQYLKENGRLYFEIGHDQGHAVTILMEEAGFTQVKVRKDLAGLDRVVFGVYNISEGKRK